MSHIRAPFLLALILLVGVAVVAQTTPQPATPQPGTPQAVTPQAAPQPQATPSSPAGEPSAQEQARATLNRVSSDLNLTSDQKTKLEPILTSEIQLVHNLRADTSMTPEQKQAKFKDQLTSDHAKIDAILTPEQKQKLSQLTQQRQQQQQQASPSIPSQTPKP